MSWVEVGARFSNIPFLINLLRQDTTGLTKTIKKPQFILTEVLIGFPALYISQHYCVSHSSISTRGTLSFSISNQDQASALKVAYIFKIFEDQSCLIAAQWFHQVSYVCQEFEEEVQLKTELSCVCVCVCVRAMPINGIWGYFQSKRQNYFPPYNQVSKNTQAVPLVTVRGLI